MMKLSFSLHDLIVSKLIVLIYELKASLHQEPVKLFLAHQIDSDDSVIFDRRDYIPLQNEDILITAINKKKA